MRARTHIHIYVCMNVCVYAHTQRGMRERERGGGGDLAPSRRIEGNILPIQNQLSDILMVNPHHSNRSILFEVIINQST